MPTLPRIFIVNGLLGFVISGAFIILLLWLNVSGLRDMVMMSDDGLFGLGLIWFMNGLLFGAVQIAYVVMTAGEDN